MHDDSLTLVQTRNNQRDTFANELLFKMRPSRFDTAEEILQRGGVQEGEG
jgi:hypothetical protein